MDKIRNVAVLIGSLRKDSINRKVADFRDATTLLRPAR